MADVSFYCSCGGAYKASGRLPAGLEDVLTGVRAQHIADGHQEVDARGAAAARRRNERIERDG